MKFDSVKEAIEWYSLYKMNLFYCSITQTCIDVKQGIRSLQGHDSIENFTEDRMIGIVDIGQILDKLPPLMRSGIIIFAENNSLIVGIRHMEEQDAIFTRQSERKKYQDLKQGINLVYQALLDGDYINEKAPITNADESTMA